MKPATLGQASYLLDLCREKELSSVHLQALIDSGLLADLLDADPTWVNRAEFRELLRREPTLNSVLAAYRLQITTYPDGVNVIDLGTVEVDTDQDVDEQFKALGLLPIGGCVAVGNLPFKKEGKLLVPVKLVGMGTGQFFTQTSAIMATVKQHAQREGSLLETLAIHKTFPELVRFRRLVALRSFLLERNGCPPVFVLYRSAFGCAVTLECCRKSWSYFDWFVAAGLPVSEQVTTAPK